MWGRPGDREQTEKTALRQLVCVHLRPLGSCGTDEKRTFHLGLSLLLCAVTDPPHPRPRPITGERLLHLVSKKKKKERKRSDRGLQASRTNSQGWASSVDWNLDLECFASPGFAQTLTVQFLAF